MLILNTAVRQILFLFSEDMSHLYEILDNALVHLLVDFQNVKLKDVSFVVCKRTHVG
jgi:hypothetical protein